jgi:hypothetical protein
MFAKYIAGEAFSSLPVEVQSLSYSAMQGENSKALQKRYAEPLPEITLEGLISAVPLSVPDTLSTYALISDSSDIYRFLTPVFTDYLASVTSPPPPWSSTRTSECEICGRDWIPLTYHHLIPKEVHAKALKRKWHEVCSLSSSYSNCVGT